MSETFEHNPGDHEDPMAGPTWVVGVAGAVLLVVSVLGVTAICYSVVDAIRAEKVVEQPRLELEGLESAQTQRLEGPVRLEHRIENPEGELSLVIPVEQAMELIVRESSR